MSVRFEKVTAIAPQKEPAHTVQECTSSLTAVKDALYVLSGKWKLPLIVALSEGPRRYKDLQRALGDITTRILTKELKELEMNEFVKRTVVSDRPVIVTYELTEYSRTLDPVMNELKNWGVQHRERIIASMRKVS